MKAKKLVITRLNLPTDLETDKKENCLVTCTFENEKLVELDIKKDTDVSMIGNIYVGKVQNIVKNVNAAFIDIQKSTTGFYSLEDLKAPVFAHKIGKKPLNIGDELLVQVVKDPIKTKDAVLSTNLNFPGKYLVLTSENHTLGISSKIPKEDRTRLKQLFLEKQFHEFGIVIRTNALHATDKQILEEFHKLEETYLKILSYAQNRTPYSILYEAPKEERKLITNLKWDEVDEIITDIRETYQALEENVKEMDSRSLTHKLRFYEDATYSLAKLYNIEKQIERALKKHVWLKSGAYLVIEQTEALTVIDVNSGKNTANKAAKENHLKINLEAAQEIALQLRLRNISGICIVDFISMDSQDYVKTLLQELSLLFKQDQVPTQLIDMTPLGLVEITRKKIKKSLAEQFINQKSID